MITIESIIVPGTPKVMIFSSRKAVVSCGGCDSEERQPQRRKTSLEVEFSIVVASGTVIAAAIDRSIYHHSTSACHPDKFETILTIVKLVW